VAAFWKAGEWAKLSPKEQRSWAMAGLDDNKWKP
jgi:hypothetical protein